MGVRSAGFFPRIDTSAIARRGAEYTLLIVFALCFVGGAAAGALAGSGAIPDGEAILTDDGNIYGSDSFFQLLLSCSKYHLLVLLFSTSVIGVLLIPASLAFRGFTFACSAAYLAAADPEHGAALAAAALGLPSLFTVPSLFIAAQAGGLFSLRLLAAYRRRPAPLRRPERDNRVLIIAAALFAAAGGERYIVPAIVRLIIS